MDWFQIKDIACFARGKTSYITPNQSHSKLCLKKTKVPAEIDTEKGRYWKFYCLLEFGIKIALQKRELISAVR